MARKRVASQELTEIRKVLSRAKTARQVIADRRAWRENGYKHSDHELAMMLSALGTAVYALEQVDEISGYRDDDGSGSGGHDSGGNSPDTPSSPESGASGEVRGAGGDSGDSDRPAATSGLYGGI